DHSHRWLVEAGDAVEDSRLAGTVGADQRGDFTAPSLEGEVVDGHQAAELHRQVFDLQDRFVARVGGHHFGSEGHQPWPSLVKLPEIALRSFRKAVGWREPTKPRGLNTMTVIIARPNSSMR